MKTAPIIKTVGDAREAFRYQTSARKLLNQLEYKSKATGGFAAGNTVLPGVFIRGVFNRGQGIATIDATGALAAMGGVGADKLLTEWTWQPWGGLYEVYDGAALYYSESEESVVLMSVGYDLPSYNDAVMITSTVPMNKVLSSPSGAVVHQSINTHPSFSENNNLEVQSFSMAQGAQYFGVNYSGGVYAASRVYVSRDEGVSFNSPVTLTNNVSSTNHQLFHVYGNDSGLVVAITLNVTSEKEIYSYISTDYGQTFDSGTLITNNTSGWLTDSATVVEAQNGTLVLAVAGEQTSSLEEGVRVFTSANSGASWSGPTDYTHPDSSYIASFFIYGAVHDNGRIVLVSNPGAYTGPQPYTSGHIWLSSVNNGTSFTATTGTGFSGDFENLGGMLSGAGRGTYAQGGLSYGPLLGAPNALSYGKTLDVSRYTGSTADFVVDRPVASIGDTRENGSSFVRDVINFTHGGDKFLGIVWSDISTFELLVNIRKLA